MRSPSIGRVLRGGKSSGVRDPLWMIVLSLLFASVLTVYPVAYAVASWRPLFMLLVMVFWLVFQQKWCGVWFAFGIGLACDLLLDYQLGQHGLSFVLIAFLLRYLTRERRVLQPLLMWAFVSAAAFLHVLLMFILQKMFGAGVSLAHWLPWLSTALCWPLLYGLLKRWQA
ncbi:MAG: rod shape-determining protein MreD [Moraxellaceae bacterium]